MWSPIAPPVPDKMTDVGFSGTGKLEGVPKSLIGSTIEILQRAPHLDLFETVGSGCNVNERSSSSAYLIFSRDTVNRLSPSLITPQL
jgi:hypothetical protein